MQIYKYLTLIFNFSPGILVYLYLFKFILAENT